MSAAWKPESWRAKPVQQMAEIYPKEEATKVFDKLGKLPPLVQPAEVDRLLAQRRIEELAEHLVVRVERGEQGRLAWARHRASGREGGEAQRWPQLEAAAACAWGDRHVWHCC